MRYNGQGFLVFVMVAIAVQFLSEHYGAPAMLMRSILWLKWVPANPVSSSPPVRSCALAQRSSNSFMWRCCAPVVLIISILVSRHAAEGATGDKRPPILPFFAVGFLIFATLNSLSPIPANVVDVMSSLCRWALLISIAAVGIKTSLKPILDLGRLAIVLIVAETVFIAIFVLLGVAFLGQ